tara:strand:- start:296 stop:448 length:153 start_codon:yes stop_codon:yes gene_type:complete
MEVVGLLRLEFQVKSDFAAPCNLAFLGSKLVEIKVFPKPRRGMRLGIYRS